MVDSYLTLSQQTWQHEIVVEKSRFIATACRVASPQAAADVVKAVTKQYVGATHHCYAYVTTQGQKFADAGEPQGTAGLPILKAVQQQNLCDVVVVVTRYFGGVKLGTGGLARAYGRAASEVLAQASKVRLVPCAIFTVTGDYAQANAIETTAHALGQIIAQDYQTAVAYQIAVPLPQADAFTRQLADALRGTPDCTRLPDALVEFGV